MTTASLTRGRQKTTDAFRVVLFQVLAVVGAHARPYWSQIRENLYAVAGFGFFSAAGYVHSLFTGLIVTGVCFLIFEWKVER